MVRGESALETWFPETEPLGSAPGPSRTLKVPALALPLAPESRVPGRQRGYGVVNDDSRPRSRVSCRSKTAVVAQQQSSGVLLTHDSSLMVRSEHFVEDLLLCHLPSTDYYCTMVPP